ncbi:MAG: hypothetical protein SGI92_01475 [Bryobacteraceae bacterium]|nr:hypothetical protein [Bryobacteraceae bacterium]
MDRSVRAPDFVLAEAPRELTDGPLRRIGEGIGRVVYASSNWVVKRERSQREVVALIVLWRLLRGLERAFPAGIAARLMERPSAQIRMLKLFVQTVMLVIPRTLWFSSNILPVWRIYQKRNLRGTRLAESHLAGSSLVPAVATFPPTRVRVKGWPGWLVVEQAEERAECTLLDRLSELAGAGYFDDVEDLLCQFLEVRQAGWQRGLFSLDAHLKNFGIIGERIVLLDAGGLTNRWSEIESKLHQEHRHFEPPHHRLGLGPLLVARPDIAARFNARWKEAVNAPVVLRHMKGATAS